MVPTQHTYSVLIVSPAGKFHNTLLPFFPGSSFFPVDFAASSAAARQAMLQRPYDLVIINAPLTDDLGLRLAQDVSGRNSVALLFVKSELYGDIREQAVNHGVLALPKPTSSQMVSQAVDWLCAVRERLRLQEEKISTVEEKMTEIRMINHAKWALIESRGMTENEAHHYIEKCAMDRCVSKRTIAAEILESQKGE